MERHNIFLSIAIVLCCCVAVGDGYENLFGGPTTKWPEICRVMAKTRNCSDPVFRVACQKYCNVDCFGLGFVYLGSKGFCYAMTNRTEQVWVFAMQYCEAYGARLAKIQDAEDAEVLKYLRDNIVGSNQQRIWIGGLNASKKNQWAWLDRSEFTGGFWSQGQPSWDSSRNTCLACYVNGNYRHEANGCHFNYGFVCEQTPNITDVGTRF